MDPNDLDELVAHRVVRRWLPARVRHDDSSLLAAFAALPFLRQSATALPVLLATSVATMNCTGTDFGRNSLARPRSRPAHAPKPLPRSPNRTRLTFKFDTHRWPDKLGVVQRTIADFRDALRGWIDANRQLPTAPQHRRGAADMQKRLRPLQKSVLILPAKGP